MNRFLFVQILWLSFICCGRVVAQTGGDNRILLKSGVVEPSSPYWITSANASQSLRTIGENRPMLGIIRLSGSPTEAERAAYAAEGLHLQNYIPNQAWVVIVSKPLNLERLQRVPKFRGIMELAPDMKIEPELAAGKLGKWASRIPGMADLWLSFPDYFEGDSVKVWLMNNRIQIISEEFKRFRVLSIRVSVDEIRQLAGFPYVEYLQEVPSPDESGSRKSESQSRADVLRSPLSPYFGGLSGEGIVVGVGDDTDPVSHIDFSGRLINRFGAIAGSGHGLHTMGVVGGAGLIREDVTGYAPKSKLVYSFFSRIIANSPVYYDDFGMRITNNSYGPAAVGDQSFRRYDLYSAILDQMMVEKPDLLHVFAAGNSGNSNFSASPYHSSVTGSTGFGTILKSYQSAKNVLLVGAVDSTFNRASTSSRGPVQDGRLKPDLMADGVLVRSARPDNTYSRISGTSLASPAVAGGAALISEQYKKKFPTAGDPPAALLKGLLCNGAVDLGNVGPDYSYGYGSMNLRRSAEMLSNGHFVSGQLVQGDVHTGSIPVPPNTAFLKVMLCWIDLPGNPLSSVSLVNDLDLTLSQGTTSYSPLINNPVPAQVGNPAVAGVDRLNTIEQIVIKDPAAGTATYSVSGFNIPAGSEKYYLVYDVIPAGLTLTTPFGGEKLRPGDPLFISWDSYGVDSGFSLEYFDGAVWHSIMNNVVSTSRGFHWQVPAGLSGDGIKFKVTRLSDNLASTSQDVVVLQRPTITVENNAVQCEGLISVSWTPVSGATGYELMKLQGEEMKSVSFVPASQLSYVFKGLSRDTTYWVTVRPLIGSKSGIRAFAESRKPDTGSCGGPVSDGDLALTGFASPVQSGRLFSGSALSGTQSLQVKIKNLDNTDFAGGAAVLSYSVNGASSIVENVTLPSIIAQSEYVYSFSTPVNMAALGDYEVVVSLQVPGDQIPQNNVIRSTFSQLPNVPIPLSLVPLQSFQDNLEALQAGGYYKKKTGLAGANRYDFESSDAGGRVRSFVNTGFARSGSRALTLDTDNYPHALSGNYLTGTFNLGGYNVDDHDIRLNFYYMSHSQLSSAENKVWVRGADSDSWLEVSGLSDAAAKVGEYRRSKSLELNDVLKANGQNFTTSTQIRWVQQGAYQTASLTDLQGYTVDDISLSLASNDLQMAEIASPLLSNCELGSSVPISVVVRNSMSYPVTGATVSYQVNNGPVISETLGAVGANALTTHVFGTNADFSAYQTYTVRTWVSVAGDNESSNNELIVSVTNSPLITAYPYLQTFENGPGSWYATGQNSSWAYGTPASTGINRAASGVKAWKTNLTGNYNDSETSYLYSPCFQIDGMSNPTLSFMMALDMEDCGDDTFCDGAYLEYTYDGVTWTRLGAKGEGTNWYNREYAGKPVWSLENYRRWHAATIPIPQPLSALNKNIRFRFVMHSDLFENGEGLAIDDIHIYERQYEISGNQDVLPAVGQVIGTSADSWTSFTSSSKIFASVNPKGSVPVLGSTTAQTFLSTSSVRSANNAYYHNRNYTIHPTGASFSQQVGVRVYFADSEMETMLSATSCPGCINAASVLDLGISKYTNSLRSLENGTISDNTDGSWVFIASSAVSKIPYDRGYYAEFTTDRFSEFWLSAAPVFANSPLPVRLEEFTVQKDESGEILLKWSTSSQVNFSHFEIESARGNEAFRKGDFQALGSVDAAGEEAAVLSYRFVDTGPFDASTLYYRLKMVDRDGSYTYSQVRSIVIENGFRTIVYPNPSQDGIYFLTHQSSQSWSYRITDLSGRTIRSATVEGDGFVRKSVIDLRTLTSGIYLIEVVSGGISETFKVVRL